MVAIDTDLYVFGGVGYDQEKYQTTDNLFKTVVLDDMWRLGLHRGRYEALVHSIDGIVWEADPRAFRFGFVSKQATRIGCCSSHPPPR